GKILACSRLWSMRSTRKIRSQATCRPPRGHPLLSARSNRACIWQLQTLQVAEAEAEIEAFARVPLLFGNAEGGDESPLLSLAGIDGRVGRDRRGVERRQCRVSNKNPLILRRHGSIT